MTWDTEFAPNPYHGVLTLATCKPVIRRCAQIRDWISGWAAVSVYDKERKVVKFSGMPHLLYLAKVNKKLSFEDYWYEFPQKRPYVNGTAISEIKSNSSGKKAAIVINADSGDNIYEPLRAGADWKNPNDFNLINNPNHGEDNKLHDLSGQFVLICNEFFYFGVHNSLEVSNDIFEYNIPRCKKIPLSDVNATKLLEYVKQNLSKAKLFGLQK